MTVLVDTSVLIDLLRGHRGAVQALELRRAQGRLHACEITRLEVLAGIRRDEEGPTLALLGTLVWHPVDEQVAELGGELGRRWLPSHRGIDSADLAIAATAILHGSELCTRNVRHFPMFEGLTSPY